jgi:magnesium-transporting ATPase (P-type)
VKQEGDAMIACDMLYVTSSNENQTVNYSEVQLNGESAVKTMTAHPYFKGRELPAFLVENEVMIELPEPTPDLFKFDARMTATSGEVFAIAARNVLLRAMTIRYTEWVMGIALMTGHDTKAMKNMRHPPTKRLLGCSF